MKKKLLGLSFLIIFASALLGIKSASAQLIYPVPCIAGYECEWFKVSGDKSRYETPDPYDQSLWSRSSVQFYDDQATKDHLCGIEYNGFHPGVLGTRARTYNQWSNTDTEWHADWYNNAWRVYGARGVSYLDYIVCAHVPRPPSPTVQISVDPTVIGFGERTQITWSSQNTTSCEASGAWGGTKTTSGEEPSGLFFLSGEKEFIITCQSSTGEEAIDRAFLTVDIISNKPTISLTVPGSAQSGSLYDVSALGEDQDGDLSQITVTKSLNGGLNNVIFDSWNLGAGYSGRTWRSTSDSGPARVTYTAIARDAAGNESNPVSRTVDISAPVNTTPNSPLITWGPIGGAPPDSADSGQTYRIVALGADPDGNLSAVKIDKTRVPYARVPFAYADATQGDGWNYTSQNDTADTGPVDVTFTAWSEDASGLKSREINHTVRVGGTQATASVSATVSCARPGGTFSVTGSASGSNITSNILEKDSNQDGVYGQLAYRPDAGSNTVTVNVPSGETSRQYDFRVNVNYGSTLSNKVSVSIDPNCGTAPNPNTFCQTFPWLCPAPSPSYTLGVTRGGNGSGTITSNTGVINCGTSCSESVPSGNVRILYATAASGSTFAGWSGGGCTGTFVCSIAVTGNTSVIATFTSNTAPPPPQPGSCYVNPPGRDGPLSLTIQNLWGTDYAMLNWSGGDYCSHFWNGTQSWRTQSGSYATANLPSTGSIGWTLFCWSPGSTSYTPTSQYVVSATCGGTPPPPPPPSSYTITVDKPGTGSGTVTGGTINCGTTCSQNVASGQSITLTATASPGSTFTGWSGGGCSGTGQCTTVSDANKTISATFEFGYKLTLTKSGTGSGSAFTFSPTYPVGVNCPTTQTLCEGWFPPGTSVGVYATPSSGSTFTGYSGACTGTGSCWVDMNSDLSVNMELSSATVCNDPMATNNGATAACQYSGTTCNVPTALNYGGSLPCQYNNGTCNDPYALNNGSPLPCNYNSGMCTDATAINNGSPLPCRYGTGYCNDPAATNFGGAGACTYTSGTCKDPSATNNGGSLPCTYPAGGTCTDSNATNTGGPLPCTYNGSQFCNDPSARNFGGILPCSYTQVQPPPPTVSGFTLSGDALTGIRVRTSNGYETGNTFLSVNPFGPFTSTVTITVQSILSKVGGNPLPGTNAVSYTFNGGTSYTSTMNESMTYSGSGYYMNSRGGAGLPLRIRFSELPTQSYLVTFTGTGGGQTATHVMEVDPKDFKNTYTEF